MVASGGRPGDMEPEVAALVGFLNQLFGLLQTSQARYAARCHRDKGTVSRWLSGRRIPPQDFVDNLLLHVSELHGQTVTAQVQEQANRLRMEALRARNASAYEVEVLRQQLRVAEEELSRAKVHERVLVEAVAQREKDAARAEQRLRELEGQWLSDRGRGSAITPSGPAADDGSTAQERVEELQREIAALWAQLERARQAKRLAEEECLRMEARLLAAEERAEQADTQVDQPLALESRYAAAAREAARGIGSTLDVTITQQEVCAAFVPAIADGVCLLLYPDTLVDDPVRGWWEAAPALRRMARRFNGVLEEWQDLLPVGGMLRISPNAAPWRSLTRGHPHVIPRVSPGTAAEAAALLGDQGAAAWFAGCSLLALPLVVSSTPIGALVLLRTAEQPAFTEADSAQLTDLADRAALSLEITAGRQRAAGTALVLQRSMLPSSPPCLPGTQIAFRYRPGGVRADVGGDWFDMARLPGNRVALMVGDVLGRGLQSAAAMGRLRSALQTLAPLDEILRHLDNLLLRLGDEHLMATCVYAVYDPAARTCQLARAGHLPPVLVTPDGRPDVLEDLPVGVPVGVGGALFEMAEIDVPDGTTLVLCTDGLVTGGGDIGEGLASLCHLVDSERHPEEICDTLLERLPTNDKDDLALLVARFDGIHPDDVVVWVLRPDVAEVSRARQLVARQLEGWDLAVLAETTQLLVSELVTNALRVARESIGLRLMRTDRLLVEVSDDDPNMPPSKPGNNLYENGLTIVNALTGGRWGNRRQHIGKIVWGELDLP